MSRIRIPAAFPMAPIPKPMKTSFRGTKETGNMGHQTESPAVKSLHEEQARQASADAKGKLQKGLEDTFPASDPVSATNTSTVKKHVEPKTSAEGKQSERDK
jgi:hypothetical protein